MFRAKARYTTTCPWKRIVPAPLSSSDLPTWVLRFIACTYVEALLILLKIHTNTFVKRFLKNFWNYFKSAKGREERVNFCRACSMKIISYFLKFVHYKSAVWFNPAASTTKQSKFIAFIRIFLYNIITVEKIIIAIQPFPIFCALIGEPPQNKERTLYE